MNDEHPIGTTRFFRWLAGKCEPIAESLEQLSGQEFDEDHRTSLIERVNMAWAVPVNRLSCEQARLLTSQRMGLKWLATPVAIFVRHYPSVCVTFYCGDFSRCALMAFPELLECAPIGARAMLEADFGQVTRAMNEFDANDAKEFEALVADARILARGHA